MLQNVFDQLVENGNVEETEKSGKDLSHRDEDERTIRRDVSLTVVT